MGDEVRRRTYTVDEEDDMGKYIFHDNKLIDLSTRSIVGTAAGISQNDIYYKYKNYSFRTYYTDNYQHKFLCGTGNTLSVGSNVNGIGVYYPNPTYWRSSDDIGFKLVDMSSRSTLIDTGIVGSIDFATGDIYLFVCNGDASKDKTVMYYNYYSIININYSGVVTKITNTSLNTEFFYNSIEFWGPIYNRKWYGLNSSHSLVYFDMDALTINVLNEYTSNDPNDPNSATFNVSVKFLGSLLV